MIIPLTWLRQYVKIPDDTGEITRVLTSLGHMLDGQPKLTDGDTILDLEIRQNRSDCLSILGIARELSAFYKTPLNIPDHGKLISSSQGEKVIIADPKAVYRFNTVLLDIPKQAETPSWMKKALLAYGMTPINIIVDVTNFVMIEYGQPLHAFDKNLITQPLQVTCAKSKEPFTALGGTTISLTDQDLIIKEGDKPVALAGIIGADNAKVGEQTSCILLEAATYNQAFIRQTSRRHSIRTEASLRHEKFLHPYLTDHALERAVGLLVEHTGALVRATADTFPNASSWEPKTISCSYEKIRSYAGTDDISDKMSDDILRSLEFSVSKKSGVELYASVPYYRTDVTQEEDIIEEVIRMYGYDAIPSRLPQAAPPQSIQSKIWDISEEIRDIMTACGYDEQITDPLTHYDDPNEDVVILENSLTTEKDMLRTSLKLDLLHGIKNRIKYRQTDIRLFEIGTCYKKMGREFIETITLGFLHHSPDVTFADIKGVTESIFDRLGYAYDEDIIDITQISGLQNNFCCEIHLSKLITKERARRTVVLTSPPQVILQDFSFSLPADTRVGDIIKEIRGLDKRIYSVLLGEQPQKLSSDKKSVFFNITFHDSKNSLTESDIVPLRKEIIQLVENKYKGEMRGKK